jgi:hypothetical protein
MTSTVIMPEWALYVTPLVSVAGWELGNWLARPVIRRLDAWAELRRR